MKTHNQIMIVHNHRVQKAAFKMSLFVITSVPTWVIDNVYWQDYQRYIDEAINSSTVA